MTDPADQPAPADHADRDRISRTGLDRTLFVEAGAGTGKTTQLVERICNLVLDEAVPLSAIAAITFTEAAATELRSRIRVEFERRLRSPASPGDVQACTDALAEADRAAITTLHGFAGRLLGEFAVAAALPPRVRVLDEVSSQLASEERWEHFVDALYDGGDHDELLTRAALLGVPIEPKGRTQGLREVAVLFNQNWDLLEAVAARHLPPLPPVDWSPVAAAVDDLEPLLTTCLDPTDLLVPQLEAAVATVRAALALEPDARLQALDAVSRQGFGKSNVGKKKNWSDLDAVRDARTRLVDELAAVRNRAIDEVLDQLRVLTARFVLDGARQRRSDGGLEFHDLLVLARNLLRSEHEVRRVLHERYRHLLLDEFQDTDPIQIELAVLIATAVDRPGDDSWDRLATPDGSLFFVGDPKQSIYRFRRADIELFLRARDRFGAGPGLARLTTNFRTVEPVLDWVNAFFGACMASEIPGRQPAYTPLQAHRRADSGADHRPLLLGGPHPDPKVRASTLREDEAADVASTIAAVLAEPDRWPVRDRRSGSWRPAEAADITILLPTRTSLPFLREALDRSGIGYRLATGTLVYDTQEVRDVLAVLRAVDDPTDEISLVAALRSPLYACSDVDLAMFHEAGGRWDLRSTTPPPSIGAEHPVPAALAHLHSLWEQRWWCPPSAMVTRLLADRHAFLLGHGAPRPADVWRRLRFLVDQARLFEEAGGGGLRGFVEWASLQGADGARVHEPLLPETDEAVVQIMTIHGAKGLEFPITILSGMTTVPGGAQSGVSVLWDVPDPPQLAMRASLRTLQHQIGADLEAEMDEHEKLRLLYVATTRARDHLIVSCHHKTGGKPSYAQQVWTFAEGDGASSCRLPEPRETPPTIGPEAPGAGPATAGPATAVGSDAAGVATAVGSDAAGVWAERDRWIAAREALVAPFRHPRAVSATGVVHLVTETSDTLALVGPGEAGLVDEDDDHADADDDGPLRQRRGRVGTAVGQAVHGTLQVLDLAAPVAVGEVVRQLCSREAIEPLADTVEHLVQAALRSDAVALAARHRHHKELYVAAPLGDRVIEGYIDLLVETPDGLVVIDYKTDSVSSEADITAKLDRYELQAAAYAVALEATTGQAVVECRFVFCRPSGPIERPVRDLTAAKARVVAALGGGPSVVPG